jgi:hypothetical protein
VCCSVFVFSTFIAFMSLKFLPICFVVLGWNPGGLIPPSFIALQINIVHLKTKLSDFPPSPVSRGNEVTILPGQRQH